jgi:hypothetical protein
MPVMNSQKKRIEVDLIIPPHQLSAEQEKMITVALQAERTRLEEMSTTK